MNCGKKKRGTTSLDIFFTGGKTNYGNALLNKEI
jgi:hypothetical protein